MQKQDLLSIVIPVYNAKNSITNCVETMLMQSYVDSEIILVDDGSTDGSENECDRLAATRENVFAFHQENKGPGEARKLGVSHIHGEYVTFVDADDCVEKDAYNIVIKRLKEMNCDIVQFGYKETDDNGETSSCIKMKEELVETPKSCLTYFISQKNCKNFLWNKVYRSILFDNVEWLPLYYSEDYSTLAQLYGNAHRALTISDPLYIYTQLPTSICNRPFTERNLDQLKAGEYVVQYVREHVPELTAYALFYLVTNSARLAEKAYGSDVSNKDQLVKELIQRFKAYYKSMVQEEKKSGISVDLDQTTRMFHFSPALDLWLKRLMR